MFEDTGLEIWLCISGNEPISEIEILSKIAEHYKVKSADIEADINEFLASLLEEGLVEYDERDWYQKNLLGFKYDVYGQNMKTT